MDPGWLKLYLILSLMMGWCPLRSLWIQLVIISKVPFVSLFSVSWYSDPGITLAMAIFLPTVLSMQKWKQRMAFVRSVLPKTIDHWIVVWGNNWAQKHTENQCRWEPFDPIQSTFWLQHSIITVAFGQSSKARYLNWYTAFFTVHVRLKGTDSPIYSIMK